jgi:hypothetical protein
MTVGHDDKDSSIAASDEAMNLGPISGRHYPGALVLIEHAGADFSRFNHDGQADHDLGSASHRYGRAHQLIAGRTRVAVNSQGVVRARCGDTPAVSGAQVDRLGSGCSWPRSR